MYYTKWDVVSKITDDINKGMKGIEEDGVELGTALLYLHDCYINNTIYIFNSIFLKILFN